MKCIVFFLLMLATVPSSAEDKTTVPFIGGQWRFDATSETNPSRYGPSSILVNFVQNGSNVTGIGQIDTRTSCNPSGTTSANMIHASVTTDGQVTITVSVFDSSLSLDSALLAHAHTGIFVGQLNSRSNQISGTFQFAPSISSSNACADSGAFQGYLYPPVSGNYVGLLFVSDRGETVTVSADLLVGVGFSLSGAITISGVPQACAGTYTIAPANSFALGNFLVAVVSNADNVARFDFRIQRTESGAVTQREETLLVSYFFTDSPCTGEKSVVNLGTLKKQGN